MSQLPLFVTCESNWVPPRVIDLPSWENVSRLAIDCETRDEQLTVLGPGGGRRKNNYVTGVSFSIEDGPSFYLPFRHAGGDNLLETEVINYLRAQAKTFKGDLVGANLPYDLDILASDGVVFPNVRYFRDVQIADPLICELHDSYSLNSIALRWGLEGKKEDLLRMAANDYGLDPKKEMWKLPARFVGPYAQEDAELPLRILRRQEREIDDQDLWKVYNLESKLLPVLVKLRRRGVRIDLKQLELVENWSLSKEKQALEEIFSLTGVRIAVGTVWKTEFLMPVFQYLGVKVKKTPTGKPNLDQAALASIDHPAIRCIQRARKVNKLRTTFAQSIRDHMVNGRIHCNFNQLRKQKEDNEDETSGAAYGRLSCDHPNLQQQPSRDDFAAMWRAIYLPEEGKLWASNDYSQQEPRVAVHYASIAKGVITAGARLAAMEARDKYRNDPDTDNHQMMADMAGIKRKDAKEIYLGLSYGMGGAKMCRKLGLPTRMVVRATGGPFRVYPADSEEGKKLLETGARQYEAAGEQGQKLLDTFDQKVPFIKQLAKGCEQKAKAVGCITTVLGRKCRFPKDKDGNFDWTHKALNRLIQGSSADQTKQAMIDTDAAGFDIIIQVHDEIAFSVTSKEEALRASEIMKNCVPLEVPSKVDVEIGSSWGHSMGYSGKPPE